jgi:hypothetical protein
MTLDLQLDTARALTRRALLKTGGAAAVTLAIPGAALAKRRRWHRRARPHRKALGSHLRRTSYDPLVGQPFTVEGTGTPLKLVSVEDLNAHQASSDNAFALIFRAQPGLPTLADQVPQLHHPALGSFKLLISPGDAAPQGQIYSAVINRLHA